MRALTALRVCPLAAIATLASCARPPVPEAAPARVVRELFALAREGDPTEERLALVLDPRAAGGDRAELLDALALLGATAPGGEIALAALGDPEEIVADVEAGLPGGGTARYSVQLRRIDDGSWRVRWFDGPGVEWPRRPERRDEGLSVSAGPDATP